MITSTRRGLSRCRATITGIDEAVKAGKVDSGKAAFGLARQRQWLNTAISSVGKLDKKTAANLVKDLEAERKRVDQIEGRLVIASMPTTVNPKHRGLRIITGAEISGKTVRIALRPDISLVKGMGVLSQILQQNGIATKLKIDGDRIQGDIPLTPVTRAMLGLK